MIIVFATENENKVKEVSAILGGSDFDVISLKTLGIKACAEENGQTFSENAEIKAREIHDKLKNDPEYKDSIVIADDSGFCIDELGGEPGVMSARFMGHDTPYKLKCETILDKLKGLPKDRRGAQFVCDICAVFSDGHAEHAEGIWQGEVADSIKGDKGFGYDPIFYLPKYDMTAAEMPSELKNSISHRAIALKKMSDMMRQS